MASRTERAYTIPSTIPVPPSFQHAVTLGKPTPPPTTGLATLDATDQQRFQLWITQIESGVISGGETINASPALQTAMANYKAYMASPAYQNWASVDTASREYQYRLFLVDVTEALNAKATKPISNDPTGVGANPLQVSDVGVLGGPQPPEVAGEQVVSGDPVSPSLVYAGEDGSVVITF